MSYARVVLFGDTATQQSFRLGGWGARIADHFQRRVDVLNRGLEGYNTRWAKMMLPKVFPPGSASASADVIVVCFGALDAILPINKAHHVPKTEFRSNLKDILNYLIDELHLLSSSIVLLCPPAPKDELWAKTCQEKGIPVDRKNRTSWEYSCEVRELGREMSIDTVDIFSATSLSKEPVETLFIDGVLLAPRAGEIIANLVIPVLEKKVNVKEKIFPDWTEVDPKNPEKQLT